MRFKFFDIFATITELSPILCESIPRISVRLEMALFKLYPNPRDYANKARSLIFNLNDKKNPDLKLRVLQEKLSCQDLIKADPKMLASDSQKKEREKILLEDMNARRTDWAQEEALRRMNENGQEGFFKCGKCGSKKTNFY